MAEKTNPYARAPPSPEPTIPINDRGHRLGGDTPPPFPGDSDRRSTTADQANALQSNEENYDTLRKKVHNYIGTVASLPAFILFLIFLKIIPIIALIFVDTAEKELRSRIIGYVSFMFLAVAIEFCAIFFKSLFVLYAAMVCTFITTFGTALTCLLTLKDTSEHLNTQKEIFNFAVSCSLVLTFVLTIWQLVCMNIYRKYMVEKMYYEERLEITAQRQQERRPTYIFNPRTTALFRDD